jgi:predicted dinucleotide-binding enzyme
MTHRIGVLGSGDVAKILAAGCKKHGHQVKIGSRSPAKLAEWTGQQQGIGAGTFGEVAGWAEVVILAVLGRAAEEVLALAGDGNLQGKVVIDTTNPIAEGPPQGGVIPYFTGPNQSLMERLQAKVPAARFVKAFNSVGGPLMVNPKFAGGRPSMFICGNDDGAKQVVAGLLESFGWEPEDMGKMEAARAIEPLCQLWCARGFNKNQWAHAFHLLKA